MMDQTWKIRLLPPSQSKEKRLFELCFFLYSAIYRLEDYLSAVVIIVLFSSPEDSGAADLWLLNSCTVKNPSEDNFRNAVKKAQELDKHLVVAGCVPQGQPKHQIIKGISVIGVIILILIIIILIIIIIIIIIIILFINIYSSLVSFQYFLIL